MYDRVILGIDPGLAHTGWGIISQSGPRLACLAYGCVETCAGQDLPERLKKIYQQIDAVVTRFKPSFAAVETVWFGQNISAGILTSQARGAAIVACAMNGLKVEEYTPNEIKLAVVGEGMAEKKQVQYMVKKLLGLQAPPKPDHAADALAAAICFTTHYSVLNGKESRK